FEEARRLTRLHYQWVVLHEYLAKLCGPELLQRVHGSADAERLFPRALRAFVPFEFAFAVFRFGHSMVGESYKLNEELGRAFSFYAWDAIDWRSRDANAVSTLDGERVLPPRWTVQWDLFLAGHPKAQRAQRIDRRLAAPLRHLPRSDERDLAFRTL